MEWITDRQPSPEDADSDGMVCVRKNPSSEKDYWYLHWSYVGAGVPWRHSEYWWRPPSKPAPEPLATAPEPQPAPEPVASDRPALAVGQTWRRRDGEVVTIVKNDGSDEWPFETSDGKWYAPNGYLYSALHIDKQDLIELISEAPEPAPASPAPEPPATVATASEFPEAIRTGAAPFYVVVLSNEDPQNPGGEAFVWEHPIPRTTTLQSVLRQQRLHGHRYGTTYIAECRIIPLLTREAPVQQPQP